MAPRKKGAAGKGKGGTKPVEQPEAKAAPTFQLTNREDFQALARRVLSLQGTVAEASGSQGELIKEAAEKKHLHKGAFALWKKLHKFDANKIAAFLAHFDHYRTLAVKIGNQEFLSLDDRAKEQAQMFARTEAGEQEDDEDKGDGTPPGEPDQRPRFAVHEGGAAAANGAAKEPEKATG